MRLCPNGLVQEARSKGDREREGERERDVWLCGERRGDDGLTAGGSGSEVAVLDPFGEVHFGEGGDAEAFAGGSPNRGPVHMIVDADLDSLEV